jgi:hypothetical protein
MFHVPCSAFWVLGLEFEKFKSKSYDLGAFTDPVSKERRGRGIAHESDDSDSLT